MTDWTPERQSNGRWIVRDGEIVGEGWSEIDCLMDLMKKLREIPEPPKPPEGV